MNMSQRVMLFLSIYNKALVLGTLLSQLKQQKTVEEYIVSFLTNRIEIRNNNMISKSNKPC
jgi:hypothetical protein